MKNTENSNNDCSTGWSLPHSGHSRVWQLYPDGNATYWFYAITRGEEDTTGLRFEGEFGHARFQSFTVYDDITGKIVEALCDTDIEPDPGGQNPYRPDVNRNTTNRNYTVTVVPEGSVAQGLTNVLAFPKEMTRISIWLRVYLADQEVAHRKDGLSGGVPLPGIHAFDSATDADVPCPPAGSIQARVPPEPPPANSENQALFYRVSFGTLYPNQHNAYLASLFENVGEKVAVVRFKAPTFADTSSRRSEQHDVILKGNEVRYWSLNVGGKVNANTSACLADYEARVTEDGYVYSVFGGQQPSVREKAAALGYNFLGWGGHTSPVVIYRNLVADFPGGANNVDPGQSAGESNIGDYAPIGFIYASPEEFLANYDESIFDTKALSLTTLQRGLSS